MKNGRVIKETYFIVTHMAVFLTEQGNLCADHSLRVCNCLSYHMLHCPFASSEQLGCRGSDLGTQGSMLKGLGRQLFCLGGLLSFPIDLAGHGDTDAPRGLLDPDPLDLQEVTAPLCQAACLWAVRGRVRPVNSMSRGPLSRLVFFRSIAM